jgi:hypothetical protein
VLKIASGTKMKGLKLEDLETKSFSLFCCLSLPRKREKINIPEHKPCNVSHGNVIFEQFLVILHSFAANAGHNCKLPMTLLLYNLNHAEKRGFFTSFT